MSASNWGRLTIVGLVPLLLAGCLSDFAGIKHDQDPSNPPRDTTTLPPPPPVVRVKSIVIHRTGDDTLSAVGDSAQFTAEALDSTGAVVPGKVIFWMSDTAVVADVDARSGLTVARGNGVTTIRAGVDGVWAVETLTVRQGMNSLAVDPNRTVLEMLETDNLSALARDRRGNPVTRPVTFKWSSNRPFSVAVTPSEANPSEATIRRTTGGRTTITVSAEGRTASARID